VTLLDLPTFNRQSAEDIPDQPGQLIVPLVPDVPSVASIARVEELSRMLAEEKNPPQRSLFVLNRFDESRALHREIRAHLEKTLEHQLAPVAIRESEYVAEALSLGMTAIDHVPQAPVVKDFEELGIWLEAQLTSAAEIAAGKAEIA
jgi:cellulose biosynthesis protein BcsQ